MVKLCRTWRQAGGYMVSTEVQMVMVHGTDEVQRQYMRGTWKRGTWEVGI